MEQLPEGSCFSVRLTKARLLCYVKGGRDKYGMVDMGYHCGYDNHYYH